MHVALPGRAGKRELQALVSRLIGTPLDMTTNIIQSYIQGREIDMNDIQNKLDTALRQAVKGRITRREFTQLALASGVSLAAANSMLTKAHAAEPKKGGTLKIGVGHGALARAEGAPFKQGPRKASRARQQATGLGVIDATCVSAWRVRRQLDDGRSTCWPAVWLQRSSLHVSKKSSIT